MHGYHTGPAPGHSEIDAGDLLVWMLPTSEIDDDPALLTDAEHDRIRRLVEASDRRRVAAGRQLARRVIGDVLGLDPVRVQFTRGPHGKPAVVGAPHLGFNLSHDRDVVLLGMAVHRDVGVDVQYGDADFGDLGLADRICAPRERRRVAHVGATRRGDRMLQLWVRKEATLKCDGRGLGLDPRDVMVGWRRAGPTGLDRRIRLVDLPAPPGARAAAAVTGGRVRVRWQT